LLVPRSALAHAGETAIGGVEQGFLVVLIVAIVLGALLYAKGVVALWRKAGVGRGIRRGQSVNFALGWAALAGSLLSPIDAWAERSFAVHMIQHELLMVVAAPLIVLGRPLEAWAWALSSPVRRFLAAAAKTPILRTIGYVATLSVGAWMLHALALWVWHVPVLFRAALLNPLVHILQHGCFFGSAIAYWWSVVGVRARHPTGRAHHGGAGGHGLHDRGTDSRGPMARTAACVREAVMREEWAPRPELEPGDSCPVIRPSPSRIPKTSHAR